MSDYFTSNENKELLWGVLIEQNSFKDIDPKHKSNIEIVFERTIKIINFNMKNEELFNKNKEVIKEMVVYLNTLRNSSQLPSSYQNKTLNYTHDEIHKEKLERFDNQLKQKQVEFETIIKKNVPESIDFSDKMDEKIGDKMDLLISQTIAMRENQLKQILGETAPPNKQSSLDSSGSLFQILANTNNNINNTNVVNNSINSGYIKLNIGEDLDLNLSKNIVDLNKNNNKKVSFDENKYINNSSKLNLIQENGNENEIEYKTNPMKLNSFLNKLKQVETNGDLQSEQTVEIKNKTVVDENIKLDLIINLLYEINSKLDKIL